MLDYFYANTLSSKHIYLLVLGWKSLGFIVYLTVFVGSVSKSVSGRNSKKGPAKILTGPNKFVILGDKT